MKERAILFSGAMVRAILAGTKTQTRRVVKPRHDWTMDERDDGTPWPFFEHYVHGEPEPVEVPCPYGAVGDRLWVKETWAAFTGGRTQDGEEWDEFTGKIADMRDEAGLYVGTDGLVFAADGKSSPERWRPSIFMPRWASRITLEVTDVRVERVQAISDADIAAEGVTAEAVTDLFFDKRPVGVSMPLAGPQRPTDAWRIGWSTINGPESWASNPWVWVLGFRRVEP